MATGILHIDRASGGDPGVVIARLYGPRGGMIGDTQIDDTNAQEALARLAKFGVKMMPTPDELIDAAEELRALADGYDIDTSGPSRLLEQVAIALLPPRGRRDELLEGRADLDTGNRIEVHASSPIITRSEDQGAMVNVLNPDEVAELASRAKS